MNIREESSKEQSEARLHAIAEQYARDMQNIQKDHLMRIRAIGFRSAFLQGLIIGWAIGFMTTYVYIVYQIHHRHL